MPRLLPQVAPEERARFSSALAAFACVAGLGIIARTFGDTLFLSSFPPAGLSVMYAVTAVTLAALASFYPRVSARVPLESLIRWTAFASIAVAVLLRVALFAPWKSLHVVAYVFADLMCRIPMLLFWSFAAITFDPRESKRLLGLIGAGGTVACILAGSAVVPFAHRFGTANLLLIVILLLAGFTIAVSAAPRTEVRQMAGGSHAARVSGFSYYGSLLRNRQIAELAAMAFVASFALVLNDFIFKTVARAHYQGADLASFFGAFYTFTSVAALVIQIFFVRTILHRGGVSVALMVLPCALLVASAGVAWTGRFEWVVAAKFMEPVFEFTINVAAIQMLYLGIRKQSRPQARSFVDGVARPVGIAVAGLLTVALTGNGTVPVQVLGVAVLVTCGTWLWLSRRNQRNYVSGLLQSLDVRRLDFGSEEVGPQDSATEGYVREALRHAPDDDVPYLLGLLPAFEDVDWTDEYRALLRRDSPELKVVGLDWLREHGSTGDLMTLMQLLFHESPEVRRAAVRAAAAIRGSAVAPAIIGHLQDESLRVRAAAAAELLNSGDLEGLIEASIALKGMLESEDREVRTAAAEAIAFIRHDGLSRPLLDLLHDSDVGVRSAAAQAASQSGRKDLVTVIINLLRQPDAAPAAAEALSDMGPGIIEHIDAAVAEELRIWPVPEWLERVPPILARLGPESVPVFRRIAETESVHLRSVAIHSWCLLLRHFPGGTNRRELQEQMLRDARAANETLSYCRSVEALPGSEILRSVLQEEHELQVSNVFALLGTLVPSLDIASLRAGLAGPKESRAHALELIDNVLHRDLKSDVLAVFETAGGNRAAGDAMLDVLERLLARRSSTWLTVGAAYCAGRSGSAANVAGLTPLIDHPMLHVKETAIEAVGRLDPSTLVPGAAEGARLQ